MHAIVVRVKLLDQEAAQAFLHEQVVPAVKQAPGLVAAYWTRKDDTGLSMLVFESEDAANEVAPRIDGMGSDAVSFEGVEVREVVASA